MKKLLLLFAVMLSTVGAWAEGLIVGQPYLIKAANADIDLYLRNNGLNTNLKLSTESVYYFYLENSETDGQYYIKTLCEGKTQYVHATSWNGVVSESKTSFTIEAVEGDVYTINQSTSNYTGAIGVDDLAVDASVYCNKSGDKAQWKFELIDPIEASEIDVAKQYRIRSAFSGRYMECVDFAKKSGEGAFQFKKKSLNVGQLFSFVAADEGKFYLKLKDGETDYYVNCSAWNFVAGAEQSTPFSIEEVAQGVYALDQQVGEFKGYAGNVNNGNLDTKIYNNQSDKTGATIWVFEEVADVVVAITYIYKYNDIEISRETVDAIQGVEFPEMSVPFGYAAVKPSGLVTTAGEYAIELSENLPFEYSADVENIRNWYFIKMHVNYPSYICENEGVLPYSNGNSVAIGATRNTYAWAFVGDPISGFKIVNKATGNAVISTGNNADAVTTGTFEEGTSLIVCASSERAAEKYFTLKPKDGGNYLNANAPAGKLLHWDNPDGGSTIELVAYTPDPDVTTNWTADGYEAFWGTALSVADYPAKIINTGANGNNVHSTSINITTTGARSVKTQFNYTTGSCALQILGVDIINEQGQIIAADYHVGSTGGNSSNNIYTTRLPEAGTYTLRCYVWTNETERLNDTNGKITISFQEINVSEFNYDIAFAAKYATLILGYKVAIPTGVEAYVVSSLRESSAILTQIENVIPAATPIILKNVGESSNYTFAYTDDNAMAIENNLLMGTIVDKYISTDAYVLGMVNDEVGLYRATMNQLENTAFLNNANKAYLPAPKGSAARFFVFDFGTETAIENVEGAENTADAVVYDLAGRRVQNAQKGVFIVNGKVVIK